ncbi:MAG: sigma factor-like helix-turn-helix DNA-binding protein [Bacilli bacterium]|jgi:predicted DNA-binding protein YlxM (UPF0122 family)|nr:sigma factor-like helix-turn-helix DNA-binding protein [Bacilli bacterium]MDY0064512.1 sigma factor-like helix-turn-helix DNA-binding protein [Bacilli bacterium]
MDLLEKKNFYNNLYDYYRELLTKKQQAYFENYYFDDLSLAEIAENYHVSRSAVFDQLQKVYTALEHYEEKLGLLDKYHKRNDLFEEYLALEQPKMNELIEKLKNLE